LPALRSRSVFAFVKEYDFGFELHVDMGHPELVRMACCLSRLALSATEVTMLFRLEL
jgi:hypothetical protein